MPTLGFCKRCREEINELIKVSPHGTCPGCGCYYADMDKRIPLFRVDVHAGTCTYHINIRAASAELAIDAALQQLEEEGTKYKSVIRAVAQLAERYVTNEK